MSWRLRSEGFSQVIVSFRSCVRAGGRGEAKLRDGVCSKGSQVKFDASVGGFFLVPELSGICLDGCMVVPTEI